MIAKERLKLHLRCSNNQAEHFAILKSLRNIETLNNNIITLSTAIMYTDAEFRYIHFKIQKYHVFLEENIRGEIVNLQSNDCKIKFSWVKTHAGNCGNETANILAKEATRSQKNYEYNIIPISATTEEAAEEALRTGQTEWATSIKAADTRQYFRKVGERLRMRFHITPKLTAVLSGHG